MKAGSSNVFFRQIGHSATPHARAVDRFAPACNARFFKATAACHLPFVAGPSGHTACLILGAQFYGLKTVEELKEYALACFAFLAGGGNHSYHEVMFAANRVSGLPHDLGGYDRSLPETFKNSLIYRSLRRQFPASQ